MKLLQSEIDANPAATPTVQPNVDGRIVMNAGVAVVELVNSSESENNFWVWVRAMRPEDAWLEKYCRLEALGPVHGVQDNLENGKYKAYVRQRDSRRLTVRVAPPMQPESRAGVVEMVATVQSQVPLRVGGEEQTLFEFPFRVAVRPYARWTVTVEPKETHVRMLRRKRVLWATVENSGNDWLYVEIKLPKESGQLTFDRDVERIAVPPAPSSKEPAVRRVPIHLRSHYRNIRGSVVRVPVPLAATRIDAPSVARFPSDADLTVASLNLSSPVLTAPTTDQKSASGAEVAYYPPIPATFTDFVTSIRTSLMALVSLVLVCLALFYVAGFLYETTLHRYNSGKKVQFSPEPPDGRINLGDSLTITGDNLEGSDIDVTANKIPLKFSPPEEKGGTIKFTIPVQPNVPAGTDATVTIKKKGFRFLPLIPMDGVTVLNLHVIIGKASNPVQTVKLVMRGQVKLGEAVPIGREGDPSFGTSGKVFLNEKEIASKWTADQIRITIPNDPELIGADVPIRIQSADGKVVGSYKLNIVSSVPPEPTTATGTTSTGTATATTQTSDSTTGPGTNTTDTSTSTTSRPDPSPDPSLKSPAYGDVTAGVEDHNAGNGANALLTAAQAARDQKPPDPYWREYLMYAGEVAGRAMYYNDDDFKKLIAKSVPNDDPFGQALLMLVEAEHDAIKQDKKAADAQYAALENYLSDETHGLKDSKLFQAALKHHRTAP